MKGFVDTNIFLDFFDGKPEAKDFLSSIRFSDILLSPVVLFEFKTRTAKSKKMARAETEFLDQFRIEKPTTHDFSRALKLFHDRYKTRETRPKWTDLLIVETARGRGARVYTADKTDFKLCDYDEIVYPY